MIVESEQTVHNSDFKIRFRIQPIGVKVMKEIVHLLDGDVNFPRIMCHGTDSRFVKETEVKSDFQFGEDFGVDGLELMVTFRVWNSLKSVIMREELAAPLLNAGFDVPEKNK